MFIHFAVVPRMLLIGSIVRCALLIGTVQTTSIDIPIRFFTYNVMRGRYNCYEEQLKANEDFSRVRISTRADFVRANLAMMANYIRQYQPDILALQEIQESPTTNAISSEISTATYLAQQLDMTFTFSPTLFDSEVQMQYGTAILLNQHRFRLLAVEILPLPLGLEPRNSPCLTIQSRLTNVTLRACSIHFDHHPTDNTVRLQQAEALIQWLSKGPSYPTVLLGDFNANQSSATLLNLYRYFFDERSASSARPTWSECGERLKDKIDYILLDRRSAWTVKQFVHGSEMNRWVPSIDLTMLSDHVPLFAESQLTVNEK